MTWRGRSGTRSPASRNGIFVNGRNVKEAPLHANDQIEIGEHLLVFEPAGDPEQLPRVRGRTPTEGHQSTPIGTRGGNGKKRAETGSEAFLSSGAHTNGDIGRTASHRVAAHPAI